MAPELVFDRAMLLLALIAPFACVQDAETSARELFEQDRTRGRELMQRQRERPDLRAVELPVLELARDDPEALWSFLTDPETAYTEAYAAAARCAPVFPVELMPRLIRAQVLLERETELHNFGLRPHPFWSYTEYPGREWKSLAGTTRTLLGREWVVPECTSAYPILWEEVCAAPWPLRVERILGQAFGVVAPRGATERAYEWIAACLELPLASADDAIVFVRATHGAMHVKSIEVVARWRAIVLDPRFPDAARLVASRLGGAYEQWDDARGRLAIRTLAADGIAHAPDEEARTRCAYALRSLFSSSSRKDARGPAPAGAILAACSLANDPAAGPESTRLYAYAMSVCEAVQDPPFAPERSTGAESTVVAQHLEQFQAWSASLPGRWQHELEQERVMRAELERLGGE